MLLDLVVSALDIGSVYPASAGGEGEEDLAGRVGTREQDAVDGPQEFPCVGVQAACCQPAGEQGAGRGFVGGERVCVYGPDDPG